MVPLKETQNMSEVFQSGAQYIFVNNRPIKHKDLEKVEILHFRPDQITRLKKQTKNRKLFLDCD